METLNNFYKIYQEDINHIRLENWQIAFETYIIALSVFAPHIAEELWQILGHDDSIQLSNWPTIDHKLLINKEITLIVQVNGKLRGTLVIKPDLDQIQVENLVKQEQRFKPYLDNQLIKKTIFVSNKLINFVI
jgi:leucyl-tRNA synthetase